MDRSDPPYVIKLHLTANNVRNIEVKQSILDYIQRKEFGYWTSQDIEIQLRQYPLKSQIKVFLNIYDRCKAKMLFEELYRAKEMPIKVESAEQIQYNKMRAYLVKDEATLEKLAH